ncbi:MAG: dihydroorotase [Syntrophomonadaceae bacterium]|nr:dihydroorotase [Syntrophomonadaceae bacterium]
MELLLKNGRTIDPANKLNKAFDVRVSRGVITEIGPNLPAEKGEQVLDIAGCVVVPGLVDMHVHLREPGFEGKETIHTGTRAAAMGGFTAVAAMPNTHPVVDNQAMVRFVLAKGQNDGLVPVLPIGAITKGSKGEELAEMGEMAEAGAVAFSDDGKTVASSALMRRAMEYSKMWDRPIICHCEDLSLAAEGVMHEGYYSMLLGLKGIPAASEEIMVAREIILAETTGARVHIAHVSTAGAVFLIREAKKRGVKVTAEAAPHHFSLTDRAVEGYDTSTKVNPPLRSEEHVAAVLLGLKDGTLDVIATDHAPHAIEEKDVEYDYAPFGIIGLETAVPLAVTYLIEPGYASWAQVVSLLSINPARILGLSRSLTVGSSADITVINPQLEKTVDPQTFFSKARNTPFTGKVLRGWPVATIVKGRLVMENGRLMTEEYL